MRRFSPEENYELIPVDIAHDMQKQKALAFFNLTLRQQPSAEMALENQVYASDGLLLEAKNLPAHLTP